MKGHPDPLRVPERLSPAPPGVSSERWAVLVTVCRAMDAKANHGAEVPR